MSTPLSPTLGPSMASFDVEGKTFVYDRKLVEEMEAYSGKSFGVVDAAMARSMTEFQEKKEHEFLFGSPGKFTPSWLSKPPSTPDMEPEYEMDIAAGKIKEGDTFTDNQHDAYTFIDGKVEQLYNSFRDLVRNPEEVRRAVTPEYWHEATEGKIKGKMPFYPGKGILEQVEVEDDSQVKTYTKLTMETLKKAMDSLKVNSGNGKDMMLWTGESGRKEFNRAMRTEALVQSKPSFPGGMVPTHIPHSFIASIPKMSDAEIRKLIELYYNEELVYDIPEDEREDYRIILGQEVGNRREAGRTPSWGMEMRNPRAHLTLQPMTTRESGQIESTNSVLIKTRRTGQSYQWQTGFDPFDPPTPSPGGSPSGEGDKLSFSSRVKAMFRKGK